MVKTSKTSKASLFNSVSELKEFLEWSKSQGIQTVKVADLEVTFSALALLPPDTFKEMTDGGATLAENTPEPKEEDPDLFYSA